jgi:hypothetical protein
VPESLAYLDPFDGGLEGRMLYPYSHIIRILYIYIYICVCVCVCIGVYCIHIRIHVLMRIHI